MAPSARFWSVAPFEGSAVVAAIATFVEVGFPPVEPPLPPEEPPLPPEDPPLPPEEPPAPLPPPEDAPERIFTRENCVNRVFVTFFRKSRGIEQ